MKYDYLIVGAGFSGAVLAERIASQLDKKVLIIDSREHIGGNCYDETDQHGINIHKYGPHIFHTNNAKVWNYLLKFTEMELYFHKVLAVIDGEYVPIPFNFNSIYQLFPPKYAEKLESKLLDKFTYGAKIPILKLIESSDDDLKLLADFVYKNVFLGYNLKQWELKPEDLDSSVSGRVPIYLSRDNRYFQDKYQGIPAKGYTNVFHNLLNHKNIELRLNSEFQDIKQAEKFDKLIYTGTIDSFFNYSFGELPYRSLSFEYLSYDLEYFQPASQVNYPNNYNFTRITEFKHFLRNKFGKTVIAKEYSHEHIIGKNQPYYPIITEENMNKYNLYKEAAQKEKNTYFCGRLADYKYYNMDQVIAIALDLFEKEICGVK